MKYLKSAQYFRLLRIAVKNEKLSEKYQTFVEIMDKAAEDPLKTFVDYTIIFDGVAPNVDYLEFIDWLTMLEFGFTHYPDSDPLIPGIDLEVVGQIFVHLKITW